MSGVLAYFTSPAAITPRINRKTESKSMKTKRINGQKFALINYSNNGWIYRSTYFPVENLRTLREIGRCSFYLLK